MLQVMYCLSLYVLFQGESKAITQQIDPLLYDFLQEPTPFANISPDTI